MTFSINETDLDAFATDASTEAFRFRSILSRLLTAKGDDRKKLRKTLFEYLRFSPRSDDLINTLITDCVESKAQSRLDCAIDVLNQLGPRILRYAQEFLFNDIKCWDKRYPNRAYEPNDEYWYVLLRSVGQSHSVPFDKVQVIRMCRTAESRHIVEAVLESLGDIGTTDAIIEIKKLIKHEDPFISSLAAEILENLQ